MGVWNPVTSKTVRLEWCKARALSGSSKLQAPTPPSERRALKRWLRLETTASPWIAVVRTVSLAAAPSQLSAPSAEQVLVFLHNCRFHAVQTLVNQPKTLLDFTRIFLDKLYLSVQHFFNEKWQHSSWIIIATSTLLQSCVSVIVFKSFSNFDKLSEIRQSVLVLVTFVYLWGKQNLVPHMFWRKN